MQEYQGILPAMASAKHRHAIDILSLDTIDGYDAHKVPVAIVSIVNGSGFRSGKFQARLDTGADITCVPAFCLKQVLVPRLQLMPVRLSTGTILETWAYRADIELWAGDNRYALISPQNGVLAINDSEFGLLGMDVLKSFRISGFEANWTISWGCGS